MVDKNRFQGGKLPEFKYDGGRIKLYEDRGETAFPVETEEITPVFYKDPQRLGFRWKAPPKALMDEYPDFDPTLYKVSPNETYSLFDDGSIGMVNVCESDDSYFDFELVASNPYEVDLFECKGIRETLGFKQLGRAQDQLELDFIMIQLCKRSISQEKMLNDLSDFVSQESRRELLLSMQVLATVVNIYKMLPNSLVSLSVTSHCLCNMPWVPKVPNTRLLQRLCRISDFRHSQ